MSVRVDLFEWLSLQLTDAWALRGGLARLAQERSTWALEQARIRYQTKCYDALSNTKAGPDKICVG